ncbi:MAG: oligosaccharide flippase family protein [Cyclobacteriaceae bacterium]|nr:oligosaccharide flippase family protein [Cyclobacteriaceae bacterium]
MKERSYWLASGSYSILQRLFAFIFGFGSFFFLTRYFPVERFGVWALFIVVTSLVEMARTAFVQNAFIKYYKEPGLDTDALFSSSLLINFISTLFFIVILLVAIPFLVTFWNTEEIGPMILWYCAASIVLIPFTQLNFLEQANHRFKGVFLGNVTRQGVLFFCILTSFIFFPNLPLSLFSFFYFISTVFGLLVSYYLTRQYLPTHYVVTSAYLKKLAYFGRYILGTGITSSLGKYFDQFILGSINLTSVALFNASVRIINMIEIPVLSIANISYPKFASVNAENSLHEVARLYEKTVAAALAIIIPVVLVILTLPELVLTITAGQKYVSVTEPLRIMAAFFILMPFNVQFGNVCEIINKPQISFRVNLITNILSVVLNLYFIKIYGAMGAACVFAFTLLFIFIVGQLYLRVKLSVNLKNVAVQTALFYKSSFLFLRKIITTKSLDV